MISVMPVHERRAREREQRRRSIIAAARELAESEGWEAVTTRRLSERIEYSQPVLYSHFDGKSAIVRAVAVEGFAELGEKMRAARAIAAPEGALRELATAYIVFASERPALYEAMFVLPTDLPFGDPAVPEELKAAFGEFLAAVEPIAGGRDPETLAEVTWSALHGLVSLTRGNRLRASHRDGRLELLLELLGAAPA